MLREFATVYDWGKRLMVLCVCVIAADTGIDRQIVGDIACEADCGLGCSHHIRGANRGRDYEI